MSDDQQPPAVHRVPRAYFEAEFGPIDSHEHTAEIAPTVQKTPAFLVWPELLDTPEGDDQ